MKVETIINGDIQILLVPDTEMEELILKQVMRQENTLTEVRSSVVVLNKTFKGGILIGKKSNKEEEIPEKREEE